MSLQKRKQYKKKVPTGPANTAGEAIEKMLVEKRISSKINYEVLRDLETSQSSMPSTPVTPVPEPVLPVKQEFLTPRVPTRKGGRKRLVLHWVTVSYCMVLLWNGCQYTMHSISHIEIRAYNRLLHIPRFLGGSFL